MTVVFLKADTPSAMRLNSILEAYSLGSGQCVTRPRGKSSIFSSPNIQQPVREAVRGALHIDREALTEKYLGLPTASGRITEEVFEHILERARGKAQGWCEKLMSCAAKEVLIRSVIQLLPTYAMSCFKASSSQKVYAENY
jgi:hypothetical protein